MQVNLEKGEATFEEEKPVDGADPGGREKAGFMTLPEKDENDHLRRRHDLRRLCAASGTGAQGIPGVAEASVNLATARATIRHRADWAGLEAVGPHHGNGIRVSWHSR